MESSSEGGSPSRESFGSDGEESRIDSELRHLVAGEMEAMKVIEEEEGEGSGNAANAVTAAENGTPVKAMSSNSSKKSSKRLRNHSLNLSLLLVLMARHPPRKVRPRSANPEAELAVDGKLVLIHTMGLKMLGLIIQTLVHFFLSMREI